MPRALLGPGSTRKPPQHPNFSRFCAVGVWGCTCGGGGGYGDVCGVLHRSTDPGVLLGYCGVLFTVPGVLFTVPKVTIRHKRRIAVPCFRRWRAGCGWSYGTAQGTLPCYLKRRCSGLLAGFSSARGASHMPNPRRPLGTVYSTAVPARPSEIPATGNTMLLRISALSARLVPPAPCLLLAHGS